MFFGNTLNYRGTTVALTDYAHYAQKLLGHTSIIGYDQNASFGEGSLDNTLPDVLQNLSADYEVVGCTWDQIDYICHAHKIDAFYSIRGGWPEPLPSVCHTMVHAVFDAHAPHGDRYAYISKWLAESVNSTHQSQCDYVPHVVELPAPNRDLKAEWGVPSYAKMIGRHGGLLTFDIPWVKQVVSRILEYRLDYYFVFLGTEPWISHPRVMFLNYSTDIQFKSNFIASCDGMLHARERGESFGLSIAEFLYHNKPVISWSGGVDQNHTILLQDSPLMYSDASSLEFILNNFYCHQEEWSLRVTQFQPQPVMNRFQQVFLPQ